MTKMPTRSSRKPVNMPNRATPENDIPDLNIAKPRTTRSKRDIDSREISQICFKIEHNRHVDIKVYCALHGLQISELLNNILKKEGF